MARQFHTGFELVSSLSAVFDVQVGSNAALATAPGVGVTRAVLIHQTGAASSSKRSANAATVSVHRIRFFLGQLPDVDTETVFAVVCNGVNLNLRVRTDGRLDLIWGSSGAVIFGTISVNTLVTVDIRCDVTGTTYTADWRVNGVAQTQVTKAGMVAGAPQTNYAFGLSGTSNVDVWIDDWTIATASADYPLADSTEYDAETLKVNAAAAPTLAAESVVASGYVEALTRVAAVATPTLSSELASLVDTLVCAANAPPSLANQQLNLVERLTVAATATLILPDTVERLDVAITASPSLASEVYSGGGQAWGPICIWVGGGEMSIAVNPLNSDNLVSAGDTSGLKVSFDGGASWRMVNASLRSDNHYQVASVAWNPDGSAVYALVGGASSGTLYESTDNGLTWHDVAASAANVYGCGNGKGSFPDNSHPRSVGRLIQVDPVNGYIYVATYKQGVYRAQLSNINGTWARIGLAPSGSSNYFTRSICFGEDSSGDPDYDVVYVGTSTRATNSLGGHVVRITSPRAGIPTVTQMTASPVNPNRVCSYKTTLVAACTQGGDEGLFSLASAKSAAAATSWGAAIVGQLGTAPWYINAVERLPTGLIIGIDNPGSATLNPPVYKLTSANDFATSAVATPFPASGANITDQIIGGHGHYHLYETDNTRILGKKNYYVDAIAVAGAKIWLSGPGPWRSDDSAASWAPAVFGMLNIGGRRMRPDPMLPSRVYIANTDRQLYCSNDRFLTNLTTQKPGVGSMGTDIDFDVWSKTAAQMAATGSRVYVSVSERDTNTNGQVFYSDDPLGGAWTTALDRPGSRVTAIRVVRNDSNQVVLVACLPDDGASGGADFGIWTKVGSAAAARTKAAGSSGFLQNSGKKSHSMDWRPGHAIWLMDGNSGLWRSTDFGSNWTLVVSATDSNGDNVGYVACHPSDPTKVYLSTRGALFLVSNALAAPASVVVTDITGGVARPSAIHSSPDGTVILSDLAGASSAGRLWRWQAGAEASKAVVVDTYYSDLAGFPHDLARATDGAMYVSTDGAGMGRTSSTGAVIQDQLALAANSTPTLPSEVYVPSSAAGAETLVLSASASGSSLPQAIVRQLVNFGNSSPIEVPNAVSADQLIGARFRAPTLPRSFDLIGLRARMDSVGASDAPVKAVAYAAGATNPGANLTGASNEVTIPAAPPTGENMGSPSSTLTPSVDFPVAAWTSAFKEEGRVDDILRIGNVVYIAGYMTQTRTKAGAIETSRKYLVAMDATTNERLSGFNPNPDDWCHCLAAGPNGTLIVGGRFSTIGGATRNGLAMLDPTTGAAINPGTANALGNFSGAVRAVAVRGNTIFAGGAFTSVNGSTRTRLAKLDVSVNPATLSSWAPSAKAVSGTNDVRGLTLHNATNRIIVAGWFDQVAPSGSSTFDTNKKHICALDQTSGAFATWAQTNTSGGGASVSDEVIELSQVSDTGKIYAAVGGAGGRGVCFDAATGAFVWMYGANGNCQTVTLCGSGSATKVLFGHHGTLVASVKNTQIGDAGAGVGRAKCFLLDEAGVLQSWNPNITSSEGVLGGWGSHASGGKLYFGGDFNKVAGGDHPRFAVFDDSGGGGGGVTPTPAWYEMLFSGPARLASGIDYYLSLMIGGSGVRVYGGAPANVRTVSTPYVAPVIPPSGAAFWCVSKTENLGEPESMVATMEAEQGRIFAGIRKNYGTGNSPLISPEMTTTGFDKGRKWVYMNGKPNLVAPDTDTSGTFWDGVAAGRYDSQFLAYWGAIASNGRWSNALPHNYSWHHEQYVVSEPPGGPNAGVAADYIAAARHVYALCVSSGNHVSVGGCIRICFVPHWRQFYHDAVFGVNHTIPAAVQGYTFSELNPGAAYYDILGADVYVPDTAIQGLSTTHPALDMWKPIHDACVAMGKPMMTGETGIAASKGDAYYVAYLQELMDLLTGWGPGDSAGQILAICWTHRNTASGDNRMDVTPAILAQFTSMANNPFFSAVIP